MKLEVRSFFLSVNIGRNLDGPWCRIFCVLAKRCICHATYQRLGLSNFPSRVQVYTWLANRLGFYFFLHTF